MCGTREEVLPDQARAILTNRHDIAQHFFTHRLSVEIVEESVCTPLDVLWKFGTIRAFVEMDESLEPENDAFIFAVKILQDHTMPVVRNAVALSPTSIADSGSRDG